MLFQMNDRLHPYITTGEGEPRTVLDALAADWDKTLGNAVLIGSDQRTGASVPGPACQRTTGGNEWLSLRRSIPVRGPRTRGWSDMTIRNAFIIPTIAFLIIFNIFPLLYSLGFSFTEYRVSLNRPRRVRRARELRRPARRSGDLAQLHHHRRSTSSSRSAARWSSASAWRCCSTGQFPFKGLVTTLLLLPMMLSPAVVGLFWKLLYDPSWGPINYALGIGKFEWLSNPTNALFAVAITDIWMWSPFVMLLSLAGLSAVPKHLYEAAAIDRAGWWYTFRRITLPLVSPILLIALIFRTMEAFKTFDLPFVMTATASVETDLDHALPDGLPGLGHRPRLGARLHRPDRGALHHQHLRQVPQQGEGALKWPSLPHAASASAIRIAIARRHRGRR